MSSQSMQAAAPAPDAGLMSIMDSTEGAMMAVPSCSNADRYFAASMIPHHKVQAWTRQLCPFLCLHDPSLSNAEVSEPFHMPRLFRKEQNAY